MEGHYTTLVNRQRVILQSPDNVSSVKRVAFFGRQGGVLARCPPRRRTVRGRRRGGRHASGVDSASLRKTIRVGRAFLPCHGSSFDHRRQAVRRSTAAILVVMLKKKNDFTPKKMCVLLYVIRSVAVPPAGRDPLYASTMDP